MIKMCKQFCKEHNGEKYHDESALYLTPERMIVTPLKRDLALSSLFFILFSAIGIVTFGPKSWKKAEENMKLLPNEILKNNKKSYQLTVDEVTSIAITKKLRWGTTTITVCTKKGTYEFWVHWEDKDLANITDGLRKLFGEKLTTDQNSKQINCSTVRRKIFAFQRQHVFYRHGLSIVSERF
jgi:hypothetical protein